VEEQGEMPSIVPAWNDTWSGAGLANLRRIDGESVTRIRSCGGYRI
jgi:hypothetical protein